MTMKRTIAHILFSFYFYILILLLSPVWLIMKLLLFCRKNKESYFTNVKSSREDITKFASILLCPLSLFSRCFSKKLFVKDRSEYRGSPNEVSSIVLSKLRNSILLTKKFSDDIGAQYFFCLQPTLMDGNHPLTEDDKKFVDARRREKEMNFSYVDFFEKYYQIARRELANDDQISDYFVDLSELFYNSNSQRFTDTCHIGNIGQKELADEIAKRIISEENNKNK